MKNLLTDRDFWVKYWESKTDLSVHIPKNYPFYNELKALVETEHVKSAIELGGFPGYYAVLLKKYFQLEVTLLDYFIHQPITNELLAVNGLVEKDVAVIETDLFNYQPENSYDLVLSCGLIEHFNDTADIINRHIAFLKPGGSLFITIPNFRGVNGWFQKTFDRGNYDKHNLNCMDPALLKNIVEQAGLKVSKASYHGRFSIWLEKENQLSLGVRLFKKVCWLFGKVLTKLIPFESKQLSPYIIIVAKKNIK